MRNRTPRAPHLGHAVLLFLGFFLLARASPAREADSIEALLDRAAAGPWTVRRQAVEELARRASGDELFRLRAALLRDPRAGAREAVAWACEIRPALGNATLLGIALRRDPEAAVRRAAARALVHFPDRRAIAALIEALGRERDRRTRLHIADVLRRLTPAPCLLEAPAWRAWWRAHAQDRAYAPADEAPRREEHAGVVLETRTFAPVPGTRPPRRPVHFLVLPPFGWSPGVYGPYLLPLRRLGAVTWVALPSVQKLTGRSGYGSDLATYPVARLVRALEHFRSARGVDRFAVLAPGASGWIAMQYARSHPQRCAALLLVDTALDKAAYGAALRRAAARGDPGERFIARILLGEGRAGFTPRTLARIQARALGRAFSDPGDLEAGWLYARARRPQGFAVVPDIAWRKGETLDVPALFLYSAASAFSGHRDASRIRDHFPRSIVAPVEGARAAPYIETNAAFTRIVEGFLRRFGLLDPSSG